MAAVRVFLTGGLGFVGSAITNALLDQHSEWSLCIFDRNPPSEPRKAVTYLQGDICEEASVVDALEKFQATVIIHTAGLVPALPYRYDKRLRDLTWKTNVEGTRTMLAAARKTGVDKFIYTGSCCCVVDDFSTHYPNVDEKYPTSFNSTIYGEAKAAAEQLVLEANCPELLTVALRPSTLYGPEDSVLVPGLYSSIAAWETPFVLGDGMNLWDASDVRNVADAHVLAVENLLGPKTAAGEAFFIGNEEPIPFRHLQLAIWAHFDHYPPFEIHIPIGLAKVVGAIAEWVSWIRGRNPSLSRGSVGDATSVRYADGIKAREILGYRARIPTEEGLKTSCLNLKARIEQQKLSPTEKAAMRR